MNGRVSNLELRTETSPVSPTKWFPPTSLGMKLGQCSPLLIIMARQVKASVRYHITSFRMAVTKISVYNKCWQGCPERGSLEHSLRAVDWCSRYGNKCGGSWAVSSIAVRHNTPSSWPIPVGSAVMTLDGYECFHIYCSTVHNRQSMEAICCVCQWKNGCTMKYHSALESDPAICSNMDEPGGHRAN